MKYIKLPSGDILHELFSYDSETGLLSWRVKRSNIKIGDIAGSISSGRRKYRIIGIDGVHFYAHRVIYTMFNGEIPHEKQIDHINGNKLDNRLSNLRIASISQNQANTGVRQNSSLGVKGVSRNSGRFAVRIQVDNSRICIGRYKSVDDASKAYADAADRYFGEFARAK